MTAVTPYYKDDFVTLYHGDCLRVMESLPAESIDLIFTDPPYGHNNNNGDLAHRREAALGLSPSAIASAEARPIHNDGEEAGPLFAAFLEEANRLLKKGCCCCCCCCGGGPNPQFARWALMLDEAIGFKQAIPWDKGGLGMGWHYRRSYELVLVGEKPGAACKWRGGHSTPNIIREREGIMGIKPSTHQHPTEKPLALPAWFISKHSDAGDLVLDPFCGAGSTVVAAKKAGRRAIGIDTDERWLLMAAKKLGQGVLL